MTLKPLTEQHLQFLSLKGGCTDSSESTLVKVPHCSKSHVAAHSIPYWATTWENQQCGPASQEDSDKPRHQLSLIRVFVIHTKKVFVLSAGWAHSDDSEYSGSVVECLTRDRGTAGSSLNGVTVLCPWARHMAPCLVLVQPRKTRRDITEKLLTASKNEKANWWPYNWVGYSLASENEKAN